MIFYVKLEQNNQSSADDGNNKSIQQVQQQVALGWGKPALFKAKTKGFFITDNFL